MRILLLFILQVFSVSVFASVWTVDIATDNAFPTGVSSGTGSGDLRYCVNNAASGDAINFNLAAPYTITLAADLIINNCVLDGTSQLSSTGTPLVSIAGNYGIVCQFSSALYISSLRLINNPGRAAITFNSVDGVYIDGCFIGTDITGLDYSSVTPDTAIYSTSGSSNAFIGTYSPNVILTPSGIVLEGTSSCKIYNNMIGLNRKGMNPAGTKRNLKGIELISSSYNDIQYNRIGNCKTAAFVADLNSNNNTLYYNAIGKDLSSSAAANGAGILVKGINNNISSDTIANSAKISGSSGIGVEISGVNSYNNNVSSNYFSCNMGGGIIFSNGSTAYPSPTFDSTSYFFVYPDGSANISGKANPYDQIQIYVTDSCPSFGIEGKYIGYTAAYSDGTWSYYFPVGFIPGTKVTAIAVTTSPGNPSSFINPVNLVAFPCSTVKANAGPDATSCDGNLTLNGQVLNATQKVWSSSGSGSLSQDIYTLSSTASYYASVADIEAGSVQLFLSANHAGGCTTTDTLTLLLPIPLANSFGGNSYGGGGASYISACPNISGIPLDLKLYNNASGGTWSSSGGGSFSPSNTALNAIYIPNPTLDFGTSINLTFTPAQPGTCPPINGSVSMDFNNSDPVADAGINDTLCSSDPVLWLIHENTGASITESWTYLKDGTSIKDSIDYYGYRYFVPTTADLNSGTVILIEKVSSPGCISDQDTMQITYVTPPVVFAGDSSAICGSATSFSLSKATVSNNPGGSLFWTGFKSGAYIGGLLTKEKFNANATKVGGNGGDFINVFKGTFKNDSLLNTIYYPAPSDRDSIGVFLILTVKTVNEVCSVQSYFPITFKPVPDTVNAGSDLTPCQGDSVHLNGFVSAGFPYKWSSPGTGKFLPNNNTLQATYAPSQADLKKVAFNLVLTGGTEICPVRDELLLVLLPKPDVGVGFTQVVCPENTVTLSAVATGLDQLGLWKMSKGSSGVIVDSTNNTTQIINITAESNTYIWTITDTSSKCINSAEYIVNHCYYPPLTVYNALSPNNDGVGEFLEIKNIEAYKDNKVSVFNKWGEMVFKADNYDNSKENVFKGRSNVGTVQDLPNGSYYYLIDKGEAGGKPEKGFLVIQK